MLKSVTLTTPALSLELRVSRRTIVDTVGELVSDVPGRPVARPEPELELKALYLLVGIGELAALRLRTVEL